ncbi:unnamed protein product, partial [Choristocarpus tenellus]
MISSHSKSPNRGSADERHGKDADINTASGKLAGGMKVEARYKGRSRYYPGRISRVHRDGTCDIDYDDGEKERMVEPELIRVLSARSTSTGMSRMDVSKGRGGSEELEKGVKVEARYKGRRRYYPGKVANVHRDGRCDIDYDDGEKEHMVEPELIKVVSSQSRSPMTVRREVSEDQGGSELLQQGMRVEARYRGRSRFYPGKVAKVHNDGTYNIDYDDGEKEYKVYSSLVRELGSHPRSFRKGSMDVKGRHVGDSANKDGKLEEGMKVEAQYKGRSRYYPGKISRVHLNGTCDIDYDDGEKERMVDPEFIKMPHSRSGSPRRSNIDKIGEKRPYSDNNKNHLEEGMQVEARYKGRSRYYPGIIARVHKDGTCDIDYDDGEKEYMVESELIKVTALHSTSQIRVGMDTNRKHGTYSENNSGQMEEGMKVEARYKGRSRYYPGQISRVHKDGTCDIDYDDGEKERMVEPALIEVLDSRSRNQQKYNRFDTTREQGNNENVHGALLQEGMKVEARYKGRRHFYPGKVARVHHDGTCDIDYDDGEKEHMVEPELVKVVSSRSRSPRRGKVDVSEGEDGSEKLEKGVRVEARYNGRSRYYPGKVTKVHRDGTCDIDYDDGEKERMVEQELIKVVSSCSRSANIYSDESGGESEQLRQGVKIEARYKGRSRYYPGTVARLHHNGTCDIDYDDGEKEYMVRPDLIQGADSGSDNEKLEEGMKVEARYKGRSRYFPGRISRVHQDGTCDIDYDDGKKEYRVESELIAILISRLSTKRGNGGIRQGQGGEKYREGKDLEEGMRVEARYKGRKAYHPGQIARVHHDGTCDIIYDDGEKERMVELALIRHLFPHSNIRDRTTRDTMWTAKTSRSRVGSRDRVSTCRQNSGSDVDKMDGEKK